MQSSDLTISEQWSEFVEATEFSSLPQHVVEQAKSRVLDSLGTAIASRGLPVPTVAMKFIEGSEGKSTVIGHSRRVAAQDAGFVNGTLINGTTHDDFLAKSHPGAVVLPAALAVGEEEGGSGPQLLTAMVLGYDLVARAYMGGPAMLPYFRATGVCGTIGAAAAAGKMQRLSRGEMVHALGLAAVFAAGFGEGFLTGTMDVKLNVGWAARSGIAAAKLAKCGATASPTEYEGKSGFFAAFARSTEKVSEATRNLGTPFLIEDVRYKERPVCYFVQTPVHLAHEFARKNKLDAAKIEQVHVVAPEATYTNPGFKNVAPYKTPLQSRISAKFTVAAALLGKPIHEYGFYANTTEPDVLALAERIELAQDSADDENVRMKIIYDGATHRISGAEADTLRPTLEKVMAKFKRVASEFLGERTDAVIEKVMTLERVNDIRDLTNMLRAKEA